MKPQAALPGEGARGLGALVRHSALYSAAPFLRQLVAIGMNRLYTLWLAEAGVGVKETVDFWLIALQQLLGANALSAMVRFYYDRRDPRERASIVTSCVLVVSLVAWIACGIAWLSSRALTPLLLGRGGTIGSDELVQIVQLALLLVPFQLSTLSGFYYLQILKRSGLYSTLQTIKLLFEVGLNFLLLGHYGLGVRGFLLSMLAGEALTSLALCTWMFARLGLRIDRELLRPVLRYALPLVPVGLCQLVLHQADRRLILELGSQDMAGIYGHGYKIGYLVTSMVLGPFLQIWHPWVFGIEDPGARARLVARVSTYAVLATASASLGVICFGRQATILLAGRPAFWEAYRIVPVVAVGYVFWSLYHAAQVPLLVAKRTLRLFGINFLAALLNVGLNLWAIPRFGLLGAAATTLATFVFLAALGILASRSEAPVPFEIGRLLAILGCVAAAGGVVLAIDVAEAQDELALATALGLKALVGAGSLAFLGLGVLGSEERARLRAWVRHRAGAAPTADPRLPD